ncbi:MAG: energy-coupling factor transporter transmembrane protein EcfT [Candidatus Korarchaeota archaeon NZ13-K]|nr:MAG: energy-coupling factor transporter transmembrane protein EcfT [Candidatus Korarchaeota archaeon NZ13-K]
MFDPLGMFEIFRTYAGETPYSKLNPTSKFILFLTFLILPLISPSIVLQVLSVAAQVPLVVMSRSGRRVLRSLRASILFILLLLILNYATTGNIFFSAAMVMRLLAMIIASAIFMNGSSPSEIGDLLAKLRVPTSISFSFIIALRFIPVLADDFMNILSSQASRGYEIERGSLVRRAKSLIPVLIPLIVIAIRRAQQLAEALESRCFGSGLRRTSYVVYEVKLADVLAVVYSLSLLVLGVYMSTLPVGLPLLQFR